MANEEEMFEAALQLIEEAVDALTTMSESEWMYLYTRTDSEMIRSALDLMEHMRLFEAEHSYEPVKSYSGKISVRAPAPNLDEFFRHRRPDRRLEDLVRRKVFPHKPITIKGVWNE